MPALDELTAAYEEAAGDAAFQAELARLLSDYAGRPTPLFHAERLSARCGARIFSSARTSATPAPTRSTTSSARPCSPGGWASAASSPRPARASTASPRRPRPRCSDLECVVYMGAEDMRSAGAQRRAHAPARRARSSPWRAARARSRTRSTRRCATGSPTCATTFYVIGSVAGPASVPGDGARLPGRDRRRDHRAGARALRPPPRRDRRVRRRGLQRHGHLPRLPRPRLGAADRRRGGRRRPGRPATAPRSPRARRASCTARTATCSRTPGARWPRRTRSRPASTTPAWGPSTRGSRTRAGRRMRRRPTRKPSPPSARSRSSRASSRRSRAPTPWPTCCAARRASSRPPRRRRRRGRFTIPGETDGFEPDGTRFARGDLVIVNLSGRGDKDVYEAGAKLGVLS